MMRHDSQGGGRRLLLAATLAATAVGLYVLNQSISTQLGSSDVSSEIPAFVRIGAPQPDTKRKPPVHNYQASDVLKRVEVVRGADYLDFIFEANGEIIATQKFDGDKLIESEGFIPNGVIRFVDTYNNMTGTETYYHGVQQGQAYAYYPDKKPMWEWEYDKGRLVKSRHFFPNGTVRFESDMTDAIRLKDDDEVGIGKLYYPNGELKYEWHLTYKDNGGYKKSYNQDGTVRHVAYFDVRGRPVDDTPKK